MNTEIRVTLHPIDDRAFWTRMGADPRAAALRDTLLAHAEAAAARPPTLAATDYLAARRSNDRACVDRVWQNDRATLTALAFRRCLLGLDPADPDDRLLDWLWSMLTAPTWAVSAHLPGSDLPSSANPTLDLAACEMAAFMTELRQALKPWMDSVSKTLADSIAIEIDRRILQPFAAGVEVWWDNPARQINNWAGVCAGNILAACESLAAQGHPRLQARARALKGLNLFLDRGFTPSGECDEGIGYWSYGVSMACLGWSRLSRAEFEATVDIARLKSVAEYPHRAYLFDNSFYTANDGGLRARAGISFVPWLAQAVGSEWMTRWARQATAIECRSFGQVVTALDAINRGWVSATPDTSIDLQAPSGTQWLPDQQAAVIRIPAARGHLLLTLSGGNNTENHNHNDLGHFMVALDERWLVPDLGAPAYTADFFGPRRYTYLAASSRGHCCPVIDGQEQRPGHEAAGQVLRWEPDAARACLELDLTTAYPAEAGLQQWVRRLERQGERAVLADAFHTTRSAVPVTQVLWSLVEPVVGPNATIRLDRLSLTLSPAPRAVRVTPVNPADHALREFRETLYRIEADYETDADGRLATTLTLTA